MWQDQQVAHVVDVAQRSDDVLLSEPVTFDELLLSKSVLTGLKKSGFNKPSPIQLKAIPLGRCGLDLVVQAKSGTGKTCVFTVIALDVINVQTSALQVIILAPTREIALQIHGVVSCIGQDLQGLSAQVFIGGTLVADDRIKAKKCHIAIGSPGRLKQLIELRILDPANVRIFVLDEADKLVEEGSFQKQINWIYSTLPVNKQMLALSATYPEELANFLTKYMREPTFVRLDASHPSLLGLRQYYRVIHDCNLPHLLFEQKAKEVIHLLSNVTFQQALVFSNYHSRAESICEALSSNGWPSAYISGNMDQNRRTEAINKLKQFKCRVLISTDLTSRGIDAQNVDLVINMDVPFDWETYMHRIGRAGRFGSRGVAVSLVGAGDEEIKLQSIAAQCNATIMPLHDVTKELGEVLKQNVVDVKQEVQPIQTNMFSQDDSKVENGDDRYQTPQAKVKPGVFVNQNAKSRDFVASQSSDASLASRESSKCPSDEEHKTTDNVSVEDEFFDKIFCENTSLPPIPSLKELMSKTEHLRKNRHYLNMNYQDLKADFEYFVRTGEFAIPSTQETNSQITELESKMSFLSARGIEDSETSNDNVRTSPNNGSYVTSPVSNSTRTPLELKPSISSNLRQNVNPKLVKHFPFKSSSKTNNFGAVVRKRHPQCAAAGLDSLKHWTSVEKENIRLSPKISVPAASGTRLFDTENTSPVQKDVDAAGDISSDDESSSDEFELTSEDSCSDSDYSEESDLDSTDEEYNYYDCGIPPPPMLTQFGPTGHCFSPFLCSHPNMGNFHEAAFSHQVYHHALTHARNQVFRIFK